MSGPGKGRLAGRLLYCAGIAVLCSCIAGCGSGVSRKDMEERRAIIDHYKTVILDQDKNSARYDQALAMVREYIEAPGAEKKAETQAALWELIGQMEEECDNLATWTAPEDLEKRLANQGISVVEYESNANGRYTGLKDYIQDLSFLDFYLEVSDMDQTAMDNLTAAVNRYEAYQKEIRAYQYTGVNYWFASWGQEEAAYVKEQVLDQFTSFAAENYQWETSREAVEDKMNICLDHVEELLDDMVKFLGESTEQLYDMMEQRDQTGQ